MYKKGDLVIYSNQSVCRIEDVGQIKIGNSPNERMYYTLVPLFMVGKAYIPVDSDVYMRELITKKEVNRLLLMIPDMQTDILDNQTNKETADYYKDQVNEYTCQDLLELICNVNAKEVKMLSEGKKLGQTDERYKKEAEDMLYQELSVVLDISKEETVKHLASYIKN